MKTKKKKIICITLSVLLALGLFAAGMIVQSTRPVVEIKTVGKYTDSPELEHKTDAMAFQFSAEAKAIILQAYNTVESNIDYYLGMCNDENNKDWVIKEVDGKPAMYYEDKRVAIITDIDDTIQDTSFYNSRKMVSDAPYTNIAMARYLLDEQITPLPGAVDMINYAVDNGIEVFYVTNRRDEGYKIGESDQYGSYKASIKKEGYGQYIDKEGKEIGSSVYQALGKSMYDITMETVKEMGFPIDEKHLIVNDSTLRGTKEECRQAISEGRSSYPTGQRPDGNATGLPTEISIEPHHIIMMIGDQLSDFSDDFGDESLDALSRTELARSDEYKEKFGREWIILPNTMYGSAINEGSKYGFKNLFEYYSKYSEKKEPEQ